MSFDAIITGRTSGGRLLFTTITALSLAIMYAPVLYLLLASLNPDAQLGLVPPSRYSLKWYFALLDDGRLAGALKESALVGLATAALATPIGLSAALAYRAMTRLRGVFLLVILSAMFVPGTIEGLGLSATLRVVGLAPSWVTIAIGHLLWTLPFAAVVSLIGLSAVRPSTIAAARDLGAGPIRAFVDITLPLMRTNLISSFVFAFLLSLNEQARAYYLAGRQNTLPLYMFGAMNSGASPTIYAFSGAIIVISVAVVALVFAGLVGQQSRRPRQAPGKIHGFARLHSSASDGGQRDRSDARGV